MAVNWGLAGGNGFGNALATGLQLGQVARQRQEEKEYRNALAQYDPNNPETIKPIMEVDPRTGLHLQQQAQRAQAQQAEQRRADLPMMTRLLEHAAQGPEQWQQARGLAQQYGIDVSGLPEQFDPEWAQAQAQTMKLLATPEGQEALSTAGKQAVDMGYRPGTPEFAQAVRDIYLAGASKPYVVGGETRLYTPKIGGAGGAQGGVPPGAVEALRANPELAPQFQEKYGIDPQQFLGGAASNGSGTFQPGQ